MKPETKSAISNMASLADLVREAREAAAPGLQVGRPENGITIAEYSRECGVSTTSGRRALDGLVAEGKYEIVVAVAKTSYGNKVMRQQFYRKVKR